MRLLNTILARWPKVGHLVSRYVNRWQRNRPRLIRQRILYFPPLASQPHAQELVVLCEAKKFEDGLWSAWSWLRFLQGHLRLHLFVDGTITPALRQDFERIFPGAQLTSLREYLGEQNHRPPNFSSLLEHHLFGPKLALLLELQRETSFLYSDCDVLAFRPPKALLEVIERGSPNAYNVDPAARHDQTNVDAWISERARELSLPNIPDLNGGLLWVAQGSLDLALVERLLSGWTPAVNSHFTEQTILSVLFGVQGATPLPVADYLVSGRGMHFWERDLLCADLTVRHYIGNVRHCMYAHGYPYIAAQVLAKTKP